MIKRISLIGCGSIGTEILMSLKRGDIPNAAVLSVLDIKGEVIKQALKKIDAEHIKVFTNFEDLLNSSIFAGSYCRIRCDKKCPTKLE